MTLDQAINEAWGLSRYWGEPRPDAMTALAWLKGSLQTSTTREAIDVLTNALQRREAARSKR